MNSKSSKKNTKTKSLKETNDLEDMSFWTKVFLFVFLNIILMIVSFYFFSED